MTKVSFPKYLFFSLLLLFSSSLAGCGSGGGGGGGETVATLPAAPSNIQALEVSVTEDGARLNWTDNSINEDGFQIGYCTDTAADAGGTYCMEGWTLVGETVADFYDLTGLDSGTYYQLYVRAYNSAGASNAYLVEFTTAVNVVVLPASRDNSLSSAAGDLYYNDPVTSGNLGVGCFWADESNAFCTASLINFDLSGLMGSQIDKAILVLTVWYLGVDDGGLLASPTIPRDWQITPVADTSWGDEVTWNISEGLDYRDTESKTFAPPMMASQLYQIDVTDFVQNWTDGTTWVNNNGMILELVDYTHPSTVPAGGSDDAWAFFSNLATGFGPQLVVSYH